MPFSREVASLDGVSVAGGGPQRGFGPVRVQNPCELGDGVRELLVLGRLLGQQPAFGEQQTGLSVGAGRARRQFGKPTSGAVVDGAQAPLVVRVVGRDHPYVGGEAECEHARHTSGGQ